MPRSNRRRGSRRDRAEDAEPLDVDRLRAGWKRTEQRRDGSWYVQPVSEAQAVKEYVCPGCGLVVEPGVAHVVAWRADGVLGDAADLAGRRHWHVHCWRMKA
ncbi:hypothetical protein [Agromyces sp. SYSU T00194]|uniref:hypothetical protein n=1 Tax=Agromyces chitinivorans TaxID=3158560 RepID=UPI0033930FAD